MCTQFGDEGRWEEMLQSLPLGKAVVKRKGEKLEILNFGTLLPEAAATAEFMIRGALQQHLGGRIEIDAVEATAEEATIRIRIAYRLAGGTGTELAEFSLERGA